MEPIGWFLDGPLPIPGVCEIVHAYARTLKGKQIAELQLTARVGLVTKVSDTQIAFTMAGQIHSWDVVTNSRHLIGGTDKWIGLVSTPQQILAACTENEVYFFDPRTRVLLCKIVSTFKNFCARRSFITLGGKIVNVTENYDDDEFMEFWDRKGSESRVVLAHHVEQLVAIQDDQMASYGGNCRVYLWSHEGICLRELLCFERAVTGLAWRNDTLAVCTVDEVALFRNGEKLSSVEHDFMEPARFREDCGTFFALLDDGSVLLCSRLSFHAWNNNWEEIPLPAMTRTLVGLDHCRFVGFDSKTLRLLAFE